jgi:hypothetical protein
MLGKLDPSAYSQKKREGTYKSGLLSPSYFKLTGLNIPSSQLYIFAIHVLYTSVVIQITCFTHFIIKLMLIY